MICDNCEHNIEEQREFFADMLEDALNSKKFCIAIRMDDTFIIAKNIPAEDAIPALTEAIWTNERLD